MRLFDINRLPPQAWKNKGGVTREIAASRRGENIIWRLSVADVHAAGPFSIYPGAARVLTVIDGAGLRLKHADGVIEASPGTPVRFAGDMPIDCDLVGGRVRDFNLIYDPVRICADVLRLQPGAHLLEYRRRAFGLMPLGAPAAVRNFGDAPPQSFLMFDEVGTEIDIPADGAALLVVIG